MNDPPPDGITETPSSSVCSSGRIPQRENVFSAGMFPTVSHFPSRVSAALREERLAQTEWQKLNRQAIGRRREPHRRRRLREFGATKRLLTSTRAGETRATFTLGTGRPIRIAGCKELYPRAVRCSSSGTAQSSVRVSRRAALKALHVGYSKAGPSGARARSETAATHARPRPGPHHGSLRRRS